MSDIITLPEGIVQKYGDEDFQKLSKAGDYLPRLQLYTTATKEVKSGKFPMNHYGIVIAKDQIRDVGTELNVVPIAWRPAAFSLAGDDVESQFDQNSEAFKKIMSEAEVEPLNNFYGLQFMLWVPSQKMFVTFLFGSKTSRPEAGNMRPLIGKMATLKSRLAENKKYQWQTPVVIACSEEPSSVPDPENLKEELEKFNSPASSKPKEKAESTAESREQ